MKSLYALILIGCSACTMNVEETFLEGQNDKVYEKTESESRTNVKANAKIPFKAI